MYRLCYSCYPDPTNPYILQHLKSTLRLLGLAWVTYIRWGCLLQSDIVNICQRLSVLSGLMCLGTISLWLWLYIKSPISSSPLLHLWNACLKAFDIVIVTAHKCSVNHHPASATLQNIYLITASYSLHMWYMLLDSQQQLIDSRTNISYGNFFFC